MRVRLTFDKVTHAWTLSGSDVNLRTARDVDAWERELLVELAAWQDKRHYLLLDLGDVEVDMTVMQRYGDVLQGLHGTYARDVFAYGHPKGFTSTVHMLECQRRNLSPNLYVDRQSALNALTRVRTLKKSQKGRAPRAD